MKKLLLLSILLINSAIMVSAQNKQQQITQIENRIIQVNEHADHYKKIITHQFQNKTDEGCREYYLDGDQIILLILNNKNQQGTQKVEYYFTDSLLIATIQTHTDPFGKDSIERTYFKNNI